MPDIIDIMNRGLGGGTLLDVLRTKLLELENSPLVTRIKQIFQSNSTVLNSCLSSID